MTGLLDDVMSAPPAALVAEPMTVAEIDAHPDCIRLWATILALRAEAQKMADEAEDRGYKEGVGYA